jgi:hypothetical protein
LLFHSLVFPSAPTRRARGNSSAIRPKVPVSDRDRWPCRCPLTAIPPSSTLLNDFGPALTLTVIHAEERGTPKNRKKIDWRLITDLPVHSRKDAVEKLEWYALRWKIEMFHKILKSGCRAEESKLRTAQRLTNLLSVFCILSWRVFWMTMLNRSASDAPSDLALSEVEIALLDHLAKDRDQKPLQRKTLSHYLIKLARLGGYLRAPTTLRLETRSCGEGCHASLTSN